MRPTNRPWRRASPHNPDSANTARIYVGNMPYVAQKHDIEAIFTDAGIQIENIDLSIDPFTHKNPSYCFVDLATPDAATAAMQKIAGVRLFGRPLKVRPCTPKQQAHTQKSYSDPLVSTRWRRASPTRSSPDGVGRPLPHDASTETPLLVSGDGKALSEVTASLPPSSSSSPYRLFVSGLPKPVSQHASDLAIRTLFAECGVSVVAVSKVRSPVLKEGARDRSGGRGYYAFVDVSGEEEMQRAMENVDGVVRWGERVRVARAKRGDVLR